MRKYLKMLLGLRFRNRHHVYAVIILAVFSLTSIYAIWNYNTPQRKHINLNKTREQVQNKLVASIIEEKGTQCEIPELDPFSEEMMKFNEERPKIKCEGIDWVECEGSKCSAKEIILKNTQDILCIYKDIIYKSDHRYVISNPVKVPNEEPYFLNQSDFVKVSCLGREKSIRPSILTSRWHGYKAGLRPVQIPNSDPTPETINVMILCFDSTSHNGFIRKMPHSYKTLTEEVGAITLNGYNIVGDGTSAAIIPILSGKTEFELPGARIDINRGQYINPEDFIFKKLRRYGYRTAYYEDMPWIGTFQYRFNGFKTQPADHYIRPFFLEESKSGIKWWNGLNSRHCVGSVPQYGLMFNLTKQLVNLEQKHFSFTFIADITHNDFNWISNADDDLVAFLRHLRDSNKLNDHLVIVMGDHGVRFDSTIRQTFQGKLEERLPLMAIILPEILKKNRPEALTNLKNNQKVLTTPFDIHTTLLDAMGLNELVNKYSVPGSNMPRGLSLLKPIPKSRSCGQAGVLSHWCVCTKWHNVSMNETIYIKAAQALAKFINDLTLEMRSKCMKRHLTSTKWVMRQSNNDDLLRFNHGRDWDLKPHEYVAAAIKSQPSSEIYQAKIVMSPGKAVYEGSMKYYVKADKFVISERDISRTTEYRDEPKCISSQYPHLNKYCFCANMQKKNKAVAEKF